MKQGDLWLINLDPIVGAEIKKTRPAVIVNEDILGRLPFKSLYPLQTGKIVINCTVDDKNKTR